MELDNQPKYGLLLTKDITLHRKQFKEFLKLQGIRVVYYAPRPGKTYTTYTEIKSNYERPVVVGCVFHEHPDQKTLKKMGWVAELQENASIIDVEYDLSGLQVGALFVVPSGLDCAQGRLFRVVGMQNSIIYPSAISCEIVPEYEDTYSDNQNDYKHSSFNLSKEGD